MWAQHQSSSLYSPSPATPLAFLLLLSLLFFTVASTAAQMAYYNLSHCKLNDVWSSLWASTRSRRENLGFCSRENLEPLLRLNIDGWGFISPRSHETLEEPAEVIQNRPPSRQHVSQRRTLSDRMRWRVMDGTSHYPREYSTVSQHNAVHPHTPALRKQHLGSQSALQMCVF